MLGGGLASCLRTTSLQTAEARIAAALRQSAFDCLIRRKDLEWFQQPSTTTTTNTKEEEEEEDDENATKEDKKKEKQNAGPTTTTKTSSSSSSSSTSPAAISVILNEDVSKIASTVTTTLANLVRSSSSVVLSTYNMLTLNPALFAVAVSVVPVIGAAAMLLRKSTQRLAAQQRTQASETAAFGQERLAHLATVRHCHRDADECAQYNAHQRDQLATATLEARQSGRMMGFLFAASSSALLLVVHVGNRSVVRGDMTGGQLTSFATSSFLLGLGTSGVLKSLGEAVAGLVSAERYYDLVEDDDEYNDDKSINKINNESDEDIVNVDQVDSISVSNVDFHYKSAPDKPVLRNVSLDLSRGQVCALVGKNGAGKSSLVKILAGLHRPVAGSIQVAMDNGAGEPCKDFTRLSRDAKKRLVQVIPQSPALFNTSILENVRYSQPDASEQAVRYALAEANCTDFVSRLPGGLNFVVGLNGGKLSGGQCQRLALARALLADPFCLVLDEPTTSLDSEGSAAVAEAVLAGKHKRAMLLITHQMKTLELADTVLVLAANGVGGGQIVEQGSLEELRSNPDSELCRLMPTLLQQQQESHTGTSSLSSASSLF